MIFLKPLISLLLNLNPIFVGTKTEFPCAIPVKARRREKNKLGQRRK